MAPLLYAYGERNYFTFGHNLSYFTNLDQIVFSFSQKSINDSETLYWLLFVYAQCTEQILSKEGKQK